MFARVRRLSPFTLLPGGRWLLVLLTVLGSLMHLTRSPESGGLGWTGSIGVRSGLAALAPDTASQKTQPVSGAATPDHMDGMAMPPVMPHTVHGTELALTDAAPNAPPHHSAHQGPHCPFCLTAGFALDSEPARVTPIVLQSAVFLGLRFVSPALLVIRHADPRAPPDFQN